MEIICTDLEGIFIPEIWVNVAEKTGIQKLRLTTRDMPNYDQLMRLRLNALEANGLKLKDITDVIDGMDPLPGALEFLDWLRSVTQVIIVSDTFTQFAGPLMEKLGRPTLFCNTLVVDGDGRVTGYQLRQADGKRQTVIALKSLYYRIAAVGDSYNDITMLKEADQGILFRPPQNVQSEFPELPALFDYPKLKQVLQDFLQKWQTP